MRHSPSVVSDLRSVRGLTAGRADFIRSRTEYVRNSGPARSRGLSQNHWFAAASRSPL